VKLRKWSGLLRLAALPLAFLLSAATSYQVNHGASQNISEHSECRTVGNNHASGKALFVPTKTSGEWASFYNNPPPGVTAGACAPVVIFLTTGSTWAVPDDWNSANNTIHVIGSGSRGWGVTANVKGGGGGGACVEPHPDTRRKCEFCGWCARGCWRCWWRYLV